MFIKYFGIKNFKVFSEFTEFEFAPITVLTGKNNSGKSSLIKALQVSSDSSITKLKFNDETGDLDNTLSWNSQNKEISFFYNLPPDFGNCCVKLDYENGELSNLKLFNKENHSEILRFDNFSEEKINSEFYDIGDGTGVYDKCEIYLKYDVKWDFSYFAEKYQTNLTNEEVEKRKFDIFSSLFSGKGAFDLANRLNNPFIDFAKNEELFNSFWSNFSKKDKVAFKYLNKANEEIEVKKNIIYTIKNIENEILLGKSSFKTLIRTYVYEETNKHYGENLYLYLIKSPSLSIV